MFVARTLPMIFVIRVKPMAVPREKIICSASKVVVSPHTGRDGTKKTPVHSCHFATMAESFK